MCNIPSPKVHICRVFKVGKLKVNNKRKLFAPVKFVFKRRTGYPCRVLPHYNETGPESVSASSIFKDQHDSVPVCARERLFLVITSD